MENKIFCQSCNMPLDKPALLGTEKDGSPSKEYCTYCYQHGTFVNPGMTMEEMKTFVKGIMEKMNMDPSLINVTLNSLPHLKRWKNSLVL